MGDDRLKRAARVLAQAAIAATLVSIAASQILLGAALIACIAAYRAKLRVPPIWLPLSIFLAGTLVSLMLSADPGAGLPQVRKLYVFLIVIVAATALRSAGDVARTFLLCGSAATLSALWSFVEFWQRWRAAHELGRQFYTYYIGDRTSGFMSHWMTFGGQISIVATLVTAVLLWKAPPRRWLWWTAVSVMLAALLISFTRGMWLAAGAGGIYLIGRWRPKLLLLVPLLAVIAWLIAPEPLRQRVRSIYRPHGEQDSNYHRIVTWRTGIAMIRAHPWFGLGPEMPGREFRRFIPVVGPPLPEGWYGHLHNVYLQYAAERGVPVLLVFLWMVGKALWDWLRAARRSTAESAAVLHGCIAAVIAVLVAGIFEFNLGDSEVLMLFLALLACGYVAKPERA
ncbi:MAG TPA: O-antigen ligase family protein [Bryobacteraceae bacterium]|nr:O-antigen ligase family protein [Bryobacteraceae bacterium]